MRAAIPSADIFTLVHRTGSVSPTIERHRIRTSVVQRLPFARDAVSPNYLPLFPFAIEQFDLDGYDLVISSSHCAAKSGGRARARAAHLLLPLADAVCVGSVRRLFRAGAGRRVREPLAVSTRCCRGWRGGTPRRRRASTASWRTLNTLPAGSADTIIARQRSCIRPSTRSSIIPPTSHRSSHFLIVSALVPYKRIDLAIDACRRVGAPLRIVGDGPEREAARAAGRTAASTFLGPDVRRGDPRRVPARARRDLPGEEDFGIVPVEAQACGRPVVALARGGALETVMDGETGVLFAEPTVAIAGAALERVARDARSTRSTLRAHAEQFSRERHDAADARGHRRDAGRPGGHTMVRRYNRLLVAFYVVSDALLACGRSSSPTASASRAG